MFANDPIMLSNDPFSYGYIDDILLDPAPLDHFPPWWELHYMEGKADIDPGSRHHKWHLNEKHHNFEQNLGPWANFYDWLIEGGFHDWAYENFGIDGAKKGQMEFSCLPPTGGRLLPHTDGRGKHMGLIIYHSGFPQGLEAGPTKEGPWSEIEFIPNRLAFFIRNDDSWHKVGPIKQSAEMPTRNTITLNLLK